MGRAAVEDCCERPIQSLIGARQHPRAGWGYEGRVGAVSVDAATVQRPPSTQDSRVASIVISAFSSLETGQPAFALPASSSNFAWSAPGILALSVRWTAVMAKPSS